MSKSSDTFTSTTISARPAWARGPPQRSAASPRSQYHAPLSNRNHVGDAKQGSAVTFGSIDDAATPAAVSSINSENVVKLFGSVPAASSPARVNGKPPSFASTLASSSKQSSPSTTSPGVTRAPASLIAKSDYTSPSPSISSATTLGAAAAAPAATPELKKVDIRKLFQGPGTKAAPAKASTPSSNTSLPAPRSAALPSSSSSTNAPPTQMTTSPPSQMPPFVPSAGFRQQTTTNSPSVPTPRRSNVQNGMPNPWLDPITTFIEDNRQLLRSSISPDMQQGQNPSSPDSMNDSESNFSRWSPPQSSTPGDDNPEFVPSPRVKTIDDFHQILNEIRRDMATRRDFEELSLGVKVIEAKVDALATKIGADSGGLLSPCAIRRQQNAGSGVPDPEISA